jgi:hypothetical protein
MTLAAPLLALLAAQAAPAQAPVLVSELEPLAFLAGSCWRGIFADGRQTDTHCFTPILNGHFLRDRHVVANAPQPYAGETIYRWDRGESVIRFDYYAGDGSHSSGSAIPENGRLRFPQTHVNNEGRETVIRTLWTRDGADAYRVRSEMQQGSGWRVMLNMVMTRIGPATE